LFIIVGEKSVGIHMQSNRIYFEGNPWPEGHPIKSFAWKARLIDGEVWFDVHLVSADYYSERDIEDDEDVEYESDWKAPIVWGNYHSCTMSSNYWHEGGFKACKIEDYSPEFLDGLELEVDMYPDQIEDWDDMAFHIYLLGHDAVACHKIKFLLDGYTNKFTIVWTGLIAQAYVGDYEFKHPFKFTVDNQEFPKIN
jgi:hypothetical protein